MPAAVPYLHFPILLLILPLVSGPVFKFAYVQVFCHPDLISNLYRFISGSTALKSFLEKLVDKNNTVTIAHPIVIFLIVIFKSKFLKKTVNQL